MVDNLSIGAVGAALIAGVVSLVGLIVSKEQKISDFRQAWIDALRAEIATYLTSINAVSDALQVPYKDQSEKVEALSPLFTKLNQSHFSITLRLNPNEPSSKAVLDCMNGFQQLAFDDTNMIGVHPI